MRYGILAGEKRHAKERRREQVEARGSGICLTFALKERKVLHGKPPCRTREEKIPGLFVQDR